MNDLVEQFLLDVERSTWDHPGDIGRKLIDLVRVYREANQFYYDKDQYWLSETARAAEEKAKEIILK